MDQLYVWRYASYQISVIYKNNLTAYFSKLFKLCFAIIEVGAVFLYLLGFYFLLVSLGIDYRIAILGAIAYAFSSYFFITIEAGHNTKAHAIGYLAPVLAFRINGIQDKILIGSSLTALFTALMLKCQSLSNYVLFSFTFVHCWTCSLV